MSARHLAAAVRALSPAAAFALTVAAIFGLTGIADGAVSSGAFILGRANSESHAASLSSSKGIPLSLSAPKNTAPLVVSRNALVKNLNASMVGGLATAGLKLSGGEGFLPVETNEMITSDVFTKVAGTPKLAAGTYYVIATALINVTTGDTGRDLRDRKGQRRNHDARSRRRRRQSLHPGIGIGRGQVAEGRHRPGIVQD